MRVPIRGLYFLSTITLPAMIAALFIPTLPAMAFDSPEHCAISNLAAEIAFDYFETLSAHSLGISEISRQEVGGVVTRARNEFLPSDMTDDDELERFKKYCAPNNWPGNVSRIPFSYGKLVALVDFALSPQDLFLSTGELSEIPISKDDLNPDYFAETKKDAKDNSLWLRYELASHNNFRHFQGPTIESFNQLHEEAISAAKADPKTHGGSLFRALAYSAAGDHYLEDSLAPGHIITPRDGMYDAVALSWHDAFNDRGRMMAIRNWDQLAELRHFAQNNSRYDREFQQVGDVPDPGYMRTKLSTALEELEMMKRTPTCQFAENQGNASKLFDPLRGTFASMLDVNQQLLNESADESLPDSPQSPWICMHGDGSFDQHQRDAAVRLEVAEQKAFMVLMEARYILDVLTVYATKSEAGRVITDNYLWCPMKSIKNRFSTDVHAPSTVHSCDDLMQRAAKVCKKPDGAVCPEVFMIPTLVTQFFGFVSTPSAQDSLDLGASDILDYLYAAHIDVASGNHHSALGGGIEIGIPLHRYDTELVRKTELSEQIRSTQFTQFVGVELRGPAPRTSHAITFRGVVEIPNIDLAWGPYVNYTDIENGTVSRYRWAYGGRVEMGFSIVSLFVALGEEPFLDEPLKTIHGFGITTGFNFVINGRRAAADIGQWWRTKFD